MTTTDSRTPRTAEEWAEWALQYQDFNLFVSGKESMEIQFYRVRLRSLKEAIRRAQEQARREAIVDCFVICSKHIDTEYADINIRDEICALLKEDMHALSATGGRT